MGRMFLHADDIEAVDWDWTVVILGLYVERTSESVDDIVAVEGSSVVDIVTVAVDDIVVVDVLLCIDVVVEAIMVDRLKVVGDVAIDVVSADDDDNVVVVVVVVTDGWVVNGRLRSPLHLRVRTTSTMNNYTINDTIGYRIGLSGMYINMMTKNYIWIRWSTHLLQGADHHS